MPWYIQLYPADMAICWMEKRNVQGYAFVQSFLPTNLFGRKTWHVSCNYLIKNGIWTNCSYTKWSWANSRTYSQPMIDNICVWDNIGLQEEDKHPNLHNEAPLIIYLFIPETSLVIHFKNDRIRAGIVVVKVRPLPTTLTFRMGTRMSSPYPVPC